MITPSKTLRTYIDGFRTQQEFCEKFAISDSTLSAYLMEQQTCSSKFIEQMVEEVGFDFRAAFEIKVKRETKPDGEKS